MANEGTGERVGGYRVVRRLATGGTSEVLLAKATGPHGFERSVVLKLLLSKYQDDDDFKSMFAREAAAYARLSHPSIVRLYDFFQHGEQLVMVLEYIDGPALSKLKSMLKTVGHQLDDAASIHVAACIFDALAAAHAASDDSGESAPVIHRDANPSNVLITWDAQVKLADFGIARVTGITHESSAGMIKGTYGYMAPEQVKGEAITPRADVYAGGIILWELLSRRKAFHRGALPEIEVLRAMAEPRIVALDVLRPDLDKSLREAAKRALEPNAGDRKITAEEMVSILRQLVPQEEGREKLAHALGLVRHEPKVSSTSIPPPIQEDEPTELAHAKPDRERGMLPSRKPTPPRPQPSVSLPPRPGGPPRQAPTPATVNRQTVKYGDEMKRAVAEAGTPQPPGVPVLGPPPQPRRASTDAMPVTVAAGPAPATAPTSLGTPSSQPTSSKPEVAIFDSLVKPPSGALGAAGPGSDSERMRVGTPL